MTLEELRQLMRQRPFQPFRVHLKDGRFFDIRYPEMHLLRQGYFDIGIPAPNDRPSIADYWESVPLEEIDRVEPWSPTFGPVWYVSP
jgi:hypothetical protein